MGEASSVKVSDREIFASCPLGDTFKVWSLVYTWFSLQQEEPIGFVVEQRLGKSSGSRRVWSCAELSRELGLCQGELSPSRALLGGKENILGPSLSPWLSKGISALWDQESLRMWVGRTKPGPGRDPKSEFADGWTKQRKTRSFLLLCNKNPPDLCIPSPAPVGSAWVWGRSHEQPSDLQH